MLRISSPAEEQNIIFERRAGERVLSAHIHNDTYLSITALVRKTMRLTVCSAAAVRYDTR